MLGLARGRDGVGRIVGAAAAGIAGGDIGDLAGQLKGAELGDRKHSTAIFDFKGLCAGLLRIEEVFNRAVGGGVLAKRIAQPKLISELDAEGACRSAWRWRREPQQVYSQNPAA